MKPRQFRFEFETQLGTFLRREPGDQDRRVVWVVGADETVSTRTVRPGTRIDGYRLIHEGLSGDETIVVAGLQRLRPGAKVSAQLKGLPPTREALFRSPKVPIQ